MKAEGLLCDRSRSLEVKHAKRGHEQTVTGWNGKGRVAYVDRREKMMKE
jgi:hypothetical protein